jgi:dolichol-phosphate mannosyltransferase
LSTNTQIDNSPTIDWTPDLSLVICTLNEGNAIASVIREVSLALDGISHEIIVVDDNSQDNTQDEVLKLAETIPHLRLHVRTDERGLSSAAIKGWDLAKGQYLGVMDGDGQHDPLAIRALADLIHSNQYDLACVSRYLGKIETGLNPIRDLGSKTATWATGLVLKAPLSDPMSGCFIMRRDYYLGARPKLTGVGFKILVDIVASNPNRPRLSEVKASLRSRIGGESKLDLRVVLDLVALLVEKATKGLLPARFVLFAGVGVSGVFVHMLVLTLAFRFSGVAFDLSQGLAVVTAMTWNFFINNHLTFRDKRLEGNALFKGLINFYIACGVGAIVSLALADFLKYKLHLHWLVSGTVAALASGVWNYWAATLVSWTKKNKQ